VALGGDNQQESPIGVGRRGEAIRNRVCAEFNWVNQAARMTDFLEAVCLEKNHRKAAS
jgi:hypothetical protein